ncbi:histidinol-phosphatase HisJ [Fructilactobacillus frigidiflavus]|uniref:histidinol-phosphatase HisJ n=1 Tax=Fructilactobacillus frigidiflavus TaxID=3242688 RepID=UPI003757F9B0
MLKKDGHTHTKFSHHGTDEALPAYLQQALELGFQTYVVTEHFPFPARFLQTSVLPKKVLASSAMHADELATYQHTVTACKQAFKHQIQVQQGFEIDYLADYEAEIWDQLQPCLPWIEEVVISVHFLKNQQGEFVPIDYSPEILATEMPEIKQDQQSFFQQYFATIRQSLRFATQFPQAVTVRVGHLTLIHKYQKYFKFPAFNEQTNNELHQTLQLIKQLGFEVDLNTAGLRKEFNGEPYPNLTIIRQCQNLQIPLVFGSDAHQSADVGFAYNQFSQYLSLKEEGK